jgi:hypothetical protein
MNNSFRKLEGPFFRAVLADRVASVLAPPGPESAGRYHRPGQPILYMSPVLEWAMIAVSGYIREDGRPRVVVPLMVGAAYAVDQHDQEMCKRFGIERDLSNIPWRPALAAGQEPPSWRNADAARAAGADGKPGRNSHLRLLQNNYFDPYPVHCHLSFCLVKC